MNNNVKRMFTFIAGAALGGGVSYLYFKNKYEERYQEEVKSIKDAFSNKESKKVAYTSDSNEKSNNEELKKQINLYSEVVNTEKYNYAGVDIYKINEEEEIAEAMHTEPYLVTESEFCDMLSYGVVELIYYSDNVLVDEDDEVITDIEGTVGKENLKLFESKNTDVLLIRNDVKERYYEVLWDGRAYNDLVMDGRLR